MPQDSRAHRHQKKAASVIGLVLAAATYFGVRHLTEGHPGTAQRNAHWIQSLEQKLHLDQEVWIQQHTIGQHWVMTVANSIYIYGHWPFIILALSFLLIRHHHLFSEARNGLMLSGGLALFIFAAFPVAPPRLANPAIIDTITLHTNAYRVLQPPAFTDAYAAMPSLHCG